ncbi:MAG: putative peptidoglycan glycosyltransferase FtsW [Chloroflexi bacterium]|nr:putative peptidoglycan glycosyltransferase FtsW [Chloroflexota bacterium]
MTERAMYDARQRRIRRRIRRGAGFAAVNDEGGRSLSFQRRHLLATLDKPLAAVVVLLLAIGSLMVFSATWDWSNKTYGSATGFFFEEHLRNVGLSALALAVFATVDYRFWKRFAFGLLLITIVLLLAVLEFGEVRFGAQRSFADGRFQPGELAEFTIVLYMAAWLGSTKTRIDSVFLGLLPFLLVVGTVSFLILEQPDLSSAAIVALTASVMYLVAGANLFQMAAVGGLAGAVGLVVIESWPYAQRRIADFLAGFNDVTLSDYHTLQAITAFLRGGWIGVGIGHSEQKFGALPAPHTDSIFAIIGEELGVLGAAIVVALYIVFAIRGFQLARRAKDNFGSLLCVGFTAWVIIQALLNIAVMTGAIPSTGVPLPFISFGGSSLMVVMIGVGLMLSVNRVATRRKSTSERRSDIASFDRSWRNRRARLSRAGDRPSAAAGQQ